MGLLTFLAIILVAQSVCDALSVRSMKAPNTGLFRLIDLLKYNGPKHPSVLTLPRSTHLRRKRYINSRSDYQRAEERMQDYNAIGNAWKYAPLPPWPVSAGFNENLEWWDYKNSVFRYDENRWEPKETNSSDLKELWKDFNSEVQAFIKKPGVAGYKLAPFPSPLPADPRNVGIWVDHEKEQVVVIVAPSIKIVKPTSAPKLDVTKKPRLKTAAKLTKPHKPSHYAEAYRRKKRANNIG